MKHKGKRRLLYVAKILWNMTDEQNPISAPEIKECLETMGICADRKVIYDDITVLREFFPVSIKKGKGFYKGDNHEKNQQK